MLNLFARAHVSRVTDPGRTLARGPRRLPGCGHRRRHRRHRGRGGVVHPARPAVPRRAAGHRLRAVRHDRRRDGARPGIQHAVRGGARLGLRPHRGRRAVRRDHLVVPGQRPAGPGRGGTGVPGRRAGHLLHQGACRGRGSDGGRRPRRAAGAPDRVAGRHRLRGAAASRTRSPRRCGCSRRRPSGRSGSASSPCTGRPASSRQRRPGGRSRDRTGRRGRGRGATPGTGSGCGARPAAAGHAGSAPGAPAASPTWRAAALRTRGFVALRGQRAAARNRWTATLARRRVGSRAGPRPRRGAHRRRVRRRLARRPWPARTRRPRGVPARRGPRRPPGRPRGPPAAGQPAAGRARRPARGAGRAGAGGAAQLRPLLVRGLPAALHGPRRGAGPDGPARDRHGADVRGARAGPRRRRGVAAQRQLGPRRAVVRRDASGASAGLPGFTTVGRTAAPGVAVPPVRGLPGGARLRGAGGRRRAGRLPDAGASGCARAAWSAWSRTAT